MPSVVILIELIGIVIVLAGWGFLAAGALQRLARLDLGGFGWFELAVLGAVASYLYAGVIVLFLPLDGAADLIFALAGVAGFVSAVGVRRQAWRPWALGFGLAFSILAAASAVHMTLSSDMGTYYLPFANVLESHGLALGLANVNSRFGFNSAIAPLSSVFHGPVFGRDGLFLVGPALFLVFAGAALEQAASGFRSRLCDAGQFLALFGVASWLFAFHGTVGSWLGLSPSGDLGAAAAIVYCPVAMLGLCRAAADRDRGAYQRYAVLFPATAAFAIAAKLSAAPVALLLVLPWVLLGVRRIEDLSLRATTAGLGFAALVLSLWVLHNVLLSGCLVYPVYDSCVVWLPWTADKARVNWVNDFIRSWARAPSEPMQVALRGWDWLASWREKMLPNREFVFALLKGLPFILAAALGLRLALRGPSDERSRLGTRALAGATTVNLIGLGFWFFLAPDPRFGLGFMLSTIASSAALIVVSGASYAFGSARARLFTVVVSGAFIALLLNSARLLATQPASLVMPWRTLPVPRIRYMANGEDLTIAVPLTGKQCWDVKTLCTPEVSPNLNKSRTWGMTAYTVHGTRALRAIRGPSGSTGEPIEDPDVPLYNIERIGDVTSPLGLTNLRVTASGGLRLTGWAVDPVRKDAGSRIDVAIDGVPYQAASGIDRGDVADRFQVPAYTASGFSVEIPAGSIGTGLHWVTVRVVATGGKTYLESPPLEFTML